MACSASLLLKKKKKKKIEGAPGPLEAGERGLGSNGERSASLPLFRRGKCVYIFFFSFFKIAIHYMTHSFPETKYTSLFPLPTRLRPIRKRPGATAARSPSHTVYPPR